MTENRAEARLAADDAEGRLYRAAFHATDEAACIIERLPCEPGALRDYRFLAINPAMQRMFGLPDVAGKTIRHQFPEESDNWFDDYDRVLVTGRAERVQRKEQQRGLMLQASISPLDDAPSQILVIIARDVTERIQGERQAEEAQAHQQMLTRELSHRLKNLLAMVQSIAKETLRNAKSLDDASTKLSARILALSHAADGLTDAYSWKEGNLRDVVGAGLASVDGFGRRIVVAGPSITVGSRAALSLTLAVHELATNSIKYGALSNDDGEISLSWSVIEPSGEDDAPRLLLEWRESGGPVVRKPERRGFGTRMIDRALRGLFTGEVRLSFEPEGVIFRIDSPLSDLGASTAAS